MNRDSVQNERGPRMSTVRKQLASLRAKVRLSNGKAQFKMNQFKDKDLTESINVTNAFKPSPMVPFNLYAGSIGKSKKMKQYQS